jgi:hypothetical protein
LTNLKYIREIIVKMIIVRKESGPRVPAKPMDMMAQNPAN